MAVREELALIRIQTDWNLKETESIDITVVGDIQIQTDWNFKKGYNLDTNVYTVFEFRQTEI